MEAQYRLPIPLEDSWDWSMKEHIRLSFLYTNGQLSTGKDDYKLVKNITLPILNLQHRTEDIDLADVDLYVDDAKDFHLSFLVKKYHDDVFVRTHKLDEFFDKLNISRIDFGAGLSKKLSKGREVVPLQSIAFCDQSDMLSGPIGIKHYYSPDQLLEMASRGWGSKENGATATLEETIILSREDKKEDASGKPMNTPGRYIEVYEVHGNMPKRFANPDDNSEEYETRLFICCFYQNKDGKKNGIILFTALERESPFKVIKRDEVYGRAVGRGGAEELFDPQVGVNMDMLRRADFLDAASKTIVGVTGLNAGTITTKTNLKNLDNLHMIDLADGDMKQIDTYPRNFPIFDKDSEMWETHAKDVGAAQDPIQGKEPNSGTPFASLQAQIQQGLGLHDYRRKQYARHIAEIYEDDFIPEIQREICKGTKFLSELSMEELKYVTDALVECETQKMIKERILNGEEISKEMEDEFRLKVREQFKKKGNKHFIEILKGEFKDKPLAVKVSVAGDKRLSETVDKITKIVQFIVAANPMALAFPGTWDLINQIIEQSGLDPVDFSDLADSFKQMGQQPRVQLSPAQPTPQPQPAY